MLKTLFNTYDTYNKTFDIKNNFYSVISVIKIILWITTILLTYFNINIYEDPAIAISLWFTGLFITLWGISFFVYLGILYLINDENSDILRLHKDCYKSSLLSGIYFMINVLLVVLLQRTALLGIILLCIFILLHIILFKTTKHAH